MLSAFLCALFVALSVAPLAYADSLNVDVGDLFPAEGENPGENPGTDEKPDTGNPDDGKEPDDGDSGSGDPGGDSGSTKPDGGGSGSSGRPSGGSVTTVDTTQKDKTDTDDTKEDTEAEKKEKPADPEPIVYPEFYDVKETDWFYADVRELAGMKVIEGYTNGSFQPEGNVTRAEFIKLIVSLLCEEKYTPDGNMFKDVGPDEWYSTYIASAIVYGFIDMKDYGDTFHPDQPITRREVAKILVKALGVEAGKYKTPYADTADHNIVAMYGLCIMQGSIDPMTGERCFYPDTNITRAESAAVILRVHKLVQNPEEYVAAFKKEHNAPELELLYAPQTASEFYHEFTNAWESSQAFLMYGYPYAPGGEEMRRLKEECYAGFMLAAEHHPEFGTHVMTDICVSPVSGGSELRLTFSSGNSAFTYGALCERSRAARAQAERIVPYIVAGCENDLEKAGAIHDYLAAGAAYDFALAPASYTAYGALVDGVAVCQGYSGAFNLLCAAAGVKSLAVANAAHMWNVVLVNGVLYHYDVTYDDPGTEVLALYRGVRQAEFVPDEGHAGYRLPETDLF